MKELLCGRMESNIRDVSDGFIVRIIRSANLVNTESNSYYFLKEL